MGAAVGIALLTGAGRGAWPHPLQVVTLHGMQVLCNVSGFGH